MNSDRIEKTTVIRAPLGKVWRALTNADEFGSWFGATINGPFVAGTRVTGKITAPGYDHLTMELLIERMEPERVFSYRWHPYAIDQAVDYSQEPTTLVEFTLDEIAEGTRLTVVESGFDRIPAARRDEAFRMNDGGWTQQIVNLANFVVGSATTVP